MTGLEQIANAEQEQTAKNCQRQAESRKRFGIERRDACERKSSQKRDGQKDVARREGQQQITHQRSLAELRQGQVPAMPLF